MKLHKILLAATLACVALVSCSKDEGDSTIMIKSSDSGLYVSAITIQGSDAFSNTYVVETSGSWSSSVTGSIPATVNPSSGSGKTNITISIPANTGAARTGQIVFTSGKNTKTLDLSQGGK